MIRFLRDIRLIPIVLLATVSLFALKTAGLILDGRYTLGDLVGRGGDADITGTIAEPPRAERPPQTEAARTPAKQSWAQQMFGYPDITGAVGAGEKKDETAPKPAAKPNKPEDPPKGTAGWTPVPVEPGKRTSPAVQAILERLHERRAELDARTRELEMRESLLRAAEKRVEGRSPTSSSAGPTRAAGSLRPSPSASLTPRATSRSRPAASVGRRSARDSSPGTAGMTRARSNRCSLLATDSPTPRSRSKRWRSTRRRSDQADA